MWKTSYTAYHQSLVNNSRPLAKITTEEESALLRSNICFTVKMLVHKFLFIISSTCERLLILSQPFQNFFVVRQTKIFEYDKMVTLVLPNATMNLFCGECRARSDCTYVQSDLALHSPLRYLNFFENEPPLPHNQCHSTK